MNLRSALESLFKSSGEFEHGTLTFKKQRHLPPIKLWGTTINGGDVTEVYISFMPSNRGTVVMSELPLLINEIPRIESELIDIGVIISALHNHWIGEEPRIMYLHWEILTDDPIGLAKGLLPLWKSL